MLVRMWNNKNSHLLLVGMKISTATLEDILVVSYKISILLPYDPAIALIAVYPNEVKIMSTQKPAHGC